MKPYITQQHESRSAHDFILQPAFRISTLILSFTLVRFVLAVFFLLPAYVVVKTIQVAPVLLLNLPYLFLKSGRAKLHGDSRAQREYEDRLAMKQLAGTYRFGEKQLACTHERSCMNRAHWAPFTESFFVCGARVNVVHQSAAGDGNKSNPVIVLLHGNPSWSFMWRNIMPTLATQGHEVYALDWIGCGLSDKPLDASTISFELHMTTLRSFFSHFHIRDSLVVAHDWGGCIALSTLPHLPTGTCSSIFLLNSFFPPRPYDISLNGYTLYALWFLSTGVLDGYLPEWAVMRYMCPNITSTVTDGYQAPFIRGARTKAGVGRFAHIVPGLPDIVLHTMRRWKAWHWFEGLLGAASFTNLTAQARLAKRDVDVRQFWFGDRANRLAERAEQSSEEEQRPWVGVAFGREDPLLVDLKDVLVKGIDTTLQLPLHHRGWIEGAGHYPSEDAPEKVIGLIKEFVAVQGGIKEMRKTRID